MSDKLKVSVLEAEVRKLVASQPEFVYPTAPGIDCHYLPDSIPMLDESPTGRETYRRVKRPGCIFGQALLNVGLNSDLLMEVEDAPISDVLDWMVDLGLLDADVHDLHFHDWALVVQESQDNGTPWGDALDRADQMHKRGRYSKVSTEQGTGVAVEGVPEKRIHLDDYFNGFYS